MVFPLNRMIQAWKLSQVLVRQRFATGASRLLKRPWEL